MLKILFSILIVFVPLAQSLSAHTYDKEKKSIRILTYNTHYCKGESDPGHINQENIDRLAQVVKTLDADIVALQELDSASKHRGYRYLLQDIADATGMEYIPLYGNAAPFDEGSIGCGVLIKKNIPILSYEVLPLPGDETRAAVKVESKKFIFIGTHADLNDELRKEGTRIICNSVKDETKPIFVTGDLNDSHRWSNGGIAFPLWQEEFKIISDTIGNSIPGRTDNNALIDYVLLSKNSKGGKVKVVQSQIVRSLQINGQSIDTATISDHYPVFVDVKL